MSNLDWLPDYVERWEAREVEFRETVKVLRASYDGQLQTMSKTVSGKQAQLLKIRAIPVVGKWLYKYSEK